MPTFQATVVLICALQIGAGLWLLWRDLRFTHFGSRVRGETLKPRSISYSDDSIGYVSIAEYEVNGKRYCAEGETVSGCKQCHQAGRLVWVYYRPDQPARGRLIGWWAPIPYLILLAAGICILLFLVPTTLQY